MARKFLKPRVARRIALALYAAGRLACFTAVAQEAPPVEVIVVPPPPASVGNPTLTNPVTAATVQKTPEERRIDELLKLKFERSAAAILQAQNALAGGATAPDQPAERFRLNVVAGRWKDVGAFLKTLPARDALRIYEHLLKELDRLPVVTPAQGQQGAMPPPSPTLLQHDVLDLADIAPAPLSENSLKLLGALLVRIGGANPFFDPLIKRLQQGTLQLGGNDPQMRERAAELLLNANREIDAAQFLPPLEPGRETVSIGLLEKHVRCALAEARTAQKKEGLARAWELNLKLLSLKDLTGDLRERAWQRSAEMLPLLPAKLALEWLNDLFRNDTSRALPMLSAVGAQIAKYRSSRDIAQRKKNLELQDKVVGAVVANARGGVEWQPALNLFALNWLEEADYARRLHMPARNVRNVVEYDQFGNPIYYNSYGQPQMVQSNPNQLPALPIAELLPLAPSVAWLAAIDDTLRPRTFATLAELHLKLEDEAKALPCIEKLAPLHPKEALSIANDLLRVWATSHDPQRNMPQRRSNVVYYGPSGAYGMQGIPLTRALQQRNLKELSAMLARLRQLPIPALDDSAIVSAFTMAHSQAEVFREESIELVLGKIDELPAKTLAELLQTMRQRLATQWRKPSVQQQAKTQRTDAQIDAEILRGYELLGRSPQRARAAAERLAAQPRARRHLVRLGRVPIRQEGGPRDLRRETRARLRRIPARRVALCGRSGSDRGKGRDAADLSAVAQRQSWRERSRARHAATGAERESDRTHSRGDPRAAGGRGGAPSRRAGQGRDEQHRFAPRTSQARIHARRSGRHRGEAGSGGDSQTR